MNHNIENVEYWNSDCKQILKTFLGLKMRDAIFQSWENTQIKGQVA